MQTSFRWTNELGHSRRRSDKITCRLEVATGRVRYLGTDTRNPIVGAASRLQAFQLELGRFDMRTLGLGKTDAEPYLALMPQS